MTRKEQFLLAVFAGALLEDLNNETFEAQSVARFASCIPDEKIPHCPINAAKVLLAYLYGRGGHPYRWMHSQQMPMPPPEAEKQA